MAAPNDNISMALYCDFENVALGVRDANYDRFDIKPVLEKLLLKGSIVVKKAYCDWDRYKEFKGKMHEASFELIEIPHVRVSGKNSADIRMVVDALDLCYTKAHVNTFVIISGDSDFSPLVSKLRENAKYVIGVGVKNSTSDLLVANCDEFIFIDDLVRESRRTAASREKRQPAPRRQADVPGEERKPKEDLETRKNMAVDIVAETFDALMAERGDGGKIWASALKQAIKRRRPDFNEVYFGFRTFGNLLEEAQQRGLLDIGRDDKSGAFVYRNHRNGAVEDSTASVPAVVETALLTQTPVAPAAEEIGEPAQAQVEDKDQDRDQDKDDSDGASTEAAGAGEQPAPQTGAEQAPRRNGRYPRNNRGSRFPDTAPVSAPPLRAGVENRHASAATAPVPVEVEAVAAAAAEPVAQTTQPQAAADRSSDPDYDPLQAEWDAADAAALIASGQAGERALARAQAKGRNAGGKNGRPGAAQGARAAKHEPRRPPASGRPVPSGRPAPAGRPQAQGRKPARNESQARAFTETALPATASDVVLAPVVPAPVQVPAPAPAAAPAPVTATTAPAAAPAVENQSGAGPARKPAAKSAGRKAKTVADSDTNSGTDSGTEPVADDAAKPARKPRRPAAKKAVAEE